MTNHTSLDLVSASVRLYSVHKELIDRAAKLVPGRSTSDYIRETMAMQAALDLGVELPVTPDINRGRAGGLVNQAAAKLGMTRDQFEALAVRHMAAQTLESDALTTPAPAQPAQERDVRRRSDVRDLAPQRRAR
jgi:uncharacterized protein (DUF1778 family)